MSEYLPDRLEMQTEINKLRKQNTEFIRYLVELYKSITSIRPIIEYRFKNITGKSMKEILKEYK